MSDRELILAEKPKAMDSIDMASSIVEIFLEKVA